ncbi:MAG: aldehyde dehydrogenase family protein, partial [Bordetella sp.]|nr:aldehyde dehydrogenase family protein [Bordetella sp.]
ASQMGPLINPRRLDAVERLVGDAAAKGARVLAGGSRIPSDGFFHSLTVLADVPDDALALQEEPFGPLALLRPFDDLDSVIDEANALPFGLAAYAFTGVARNVELLSSRLECGVLGINRFVISEPETPFGGVKDSGYGREGGIEGMESYLSTKFVAHAHG